MLFVVDLAIAPGEVVVIIGPSGSGKSTLLRCLCQLEEITFEGTLVIRRRHRRTIARASPRQAEAMRGEIGMVFQNFNLFPHLTAMRNATIAPKRVRHMPEGQRQVADRIVFMDAGRIVEEGVLNGPPPGADCSSPTSA